MKVLGETPPFTLSQRDFLEKVRYSSAWLGTSPDLAEYVSIKLRFFGASASDERVEYFDAPDYRLLEFARVSPRLSVKELDRRFRRPASDPEVLRRADFFEGNGPHDIDTSVVRMSLPTGERFLLVRHESGPEIILALGVVAGSLALVKEIVALVGHLAAIHSDKWKRRFEGLQEEYDRLHVALPMPEQLDSAYEGGRVVSIERRQYEAGLLRQEVVMRIPLAEVREKDRELIIALQQIVSPVNKSGRARSKHKEANELPNNALQPTSRAGGVRKKSKKGPRATRG